MREKPSGAIYCNGKRAYDKKGAITAANNRFKHDRVKLRIYPCRGHWHLTKQVERRGWKNFKE